MRSIWFTADSHFGHANILRHSHRPFSDISQHDECLIENWNHFVRPQDDVYFLGDFMFGCSVKTAEEALRTRNRLNGAQVFFIEGNHDRMASKISQAFAWYCAVREIKVNGKKIWLSHYAHRVWPSSHYGAWHLYGHSHATLPFDDKYALSMDVGVDAVAQLLGGTLLKPENYRPLNYDEVAVIMGTRDWKPVDHHGTVSSESEQTYERVANKHEEAIAASTTAAAGECAGRCD